MRASALAIAAATGIAINVCGGTSAQAMTSKPIGFLTAMPALDLVQPVHCRRTPHAHRRGHGLSRGCDSVRLRPRLDTTPLQTIQSGTRPLGSSETRTESLRGGPDSPTSSGVRPLSSGRSGSSTGSTAPLSSSPGGSTSGSSGGSSSGGSSGGSM